MILEISTAVIPKPCPLSRACLLGCGITTGYGAVLNTAKVSSGSTVAVFGLGGVGLSVIQGAKACGASRIIGIDVNDAKESIAKEMGCTEFINPKKLMTNTNASSSSESMNDVLKNHLIKITDGGLDYTFECIGNTDIMRIALECTHKGWGVSVIIGVAEGGGLIQTRPFQLVTGTKRK